MGKRDFSANGLDAFTSTAFGVVGGEPDSIGGDAGGVMCSELLGYMANVADSLNGKLLTELVGLSEQIGDARSEPVDMLSGGLMASGCMACAAALVLSIELLRPNRAPFVCADFVMVSTSADATPRPARISDSRRERTKEPMG